MKKFYKSLRKIREVENEALKKGHSVYRLKGKGPADLVIIDHIDRKVEFVEVRAQKGKNFRIDRDMQTWPEFLVLSKRVSWDGVVDK